MFQQQEKRTIRAPLSKSSSRRPFDSTRIAVIRGIALVTLLVACAALGLYATGFLPSLSAPTQHPDDETAAAAAAETKGDRAEVSASKHSLSEETKETLVLKTKLGNIKIVLRPDLSKGSVDYIYEVMKASAPDGSSCPGCRLYRAEKPTILQGVLREDVGANTVKGSCPAGYESVPNECPEWDEHCGCHGPVMTRGMVGWAAGSAGGPDFFIDNHPDPADWWGTQHTGAYHVADAGWRWVHNVDMIVLTRSCPPVLILATYFYELSLGGDSGCRFFRGDRSSVEAADRGAGWTDVSSAASFLYRGNGP
jgi:hypothetical protein